MGRNGRVSSSGSLSGVLAKDAHLSAELETEEKELAKAANSVDDKVVTDEPNNDHKGKLVVAEEVEIGHVGWPAGLFLPLLSALFLMR